ncbi:DUF2564 family protein [Sutcliffiella horikoshii]|uniref:DUF2564 family protein n=1 Tax=Sutcliffiella horikoshii TaxID=79883 RepID=A0A5D4T0I4_9BACI|nr:DUF2564 family protein [Sutcliffiella horikoshii]TYS68471.1 DUF2564 family protein [Sutcliffiella horikoshii]
MDKQQYTNNTELHTGYNDLAQVQVSIQSAEKMVGSATMSLDPEAMDHAERAISNARSLLNDAKSAGTGLDTDFLQNCELSLSQCEHQLSEARK